MKQLANELKNKADQLARTEWVCQYNWKPLLIYHSRRDLEQARAALNQQREAQYSAQEAEAELVSAGCYALQYCVHIQHK